MISVLQLCHNILCKKFSCNFRIHHRRNLRKFAIFLIPFTKDQVPPENICRCQKKTCWLVIFDCLSLLPDAHLSNAPGRQLVVMGGGDTARIQDETTENSVWFINMLGI